MSPTKLRQQQLKCMYSPLKLGHPTDTTLICECELRLNETEKRQFHMYEHRELVKLDAPWYSPSGH